MRPACVCTPARAVNSRVCSQWRLVGLRTLRREAAAAQGLKADERARALPAAVDQHGGQVGIGVAGDAVRRQHGHELDMRVLRCQLL